MTEISVAGLALQDLLPNLLYIRIIGLVIGAVVCVHTFCMAGFLPPDKTPCDIYLPLALTGGAAAGMVAGAISGGITTIFFGSITATACWGAMAISLWLRGFHVSRYLQASNKG